ncbi:vWA domain-containing protein [Actinophytocola sp.]|uniref:vWA domain-containing protein n=1 Tax=Actinophytocola sp. TaxID=1872138 RepID=UPI003D6B01A1
MGRTGLVIGLLTLVLAGLAPGPAAAAPPPDESAQGSMTFVLDASGSMTARLPGGRTRMDAAKTAMNTLIDGLAVNVHVGLEVYGTSTGSSEGEKAAGCRDVRTLQPVGRVNKKAMRARVAGIEPRGYTPIGRSLRHAAAALPETGPRAIVLVSDGIDTCAPPAPCDVAKALDGAGVELSVHAVGFQVDPAAREQLECIASETGGEYHDAPDAETLEDLLPEIADRALRNYAVTGQSVSGAPTPEEAEYLVPGQYTDYVERRERHYYQVHVPDGATGHFSVVHTIELGAKRVDSGVDLRLIDAAKRTCAKSRGFREFTYDGPETASVSWTADADSTCDPGGPHYLEVVWDNSDDTGSDEIEILVGVEPRVLDDPGSPSAEEAEFTEPSTGQDIVWGGGSFNDAAALPGTGRYLDRVRYSEYSVYKVWLEWEQALSYRVTFLDGAAEGRATAVTELRGPTRASLRDHWWKSADYSGSAVTLGPVGTPEVSYANRSGEYAPASAAGWYYVVVKLSPVWTEDNTVPDTQPSFEIALTVSGDVAAGPRFAEVNVPSSAPPTPTARSTWTPPTATAPVVLSAAGFPWWLAGAIGAVLVFAVVVLVVLRRRSTARR